MMKAAIVFAALLGAVSPAMAQGKLVKVPAHSTLRFEIPAERDFHFVATGIKEWVDVDYRLISPVGRPLCEDLDGTAWTSCNVHADTSGTFTLFIQNVGDEDTVVEVESTYLD